MPVLSWNAPDILDTTKKAVDKGLQASAAVLVASVQNKLGLRGAPYKTLSKGRAILKQVERDGYFKLGTKGKGAFRANSARKRAYLAAVEERDNSTKDTFGYDRVDPPGGYPRRRTGDLLRSAGFEKAGELRYEAGYGTENKAHVYGGYHEFGSPGGLIPPRPVWNPSWKGEQANMLEAFMKQASIEFRGNAGQ